MDNGPRHYPVLLQPSLKEGVESPPKHQILCATGSVLVSPDCKCRPPELFLTCTSLYSENISYFSYSFSRLKGICETAGRLGKRLAPEGQRGLVARGGEGVRVPAVSLLLHVVMLRLRTQQSGILHGGTSREKSRFAQGCHIHT